MLTLKRVIAQAKKNKVAVAHFNVSELVTLKACWEAAQELSAVSGKQAPLIIGVSEGERKFIGTSEIVSLVKTLRKEHDYPIFLNADHHKSVESCTEAIDAGFDSVIIDAADKSFEENVRMTKEVVQYAQASKNKKVLIEAEIGYIGSGSEVRDSLPEGAAMTEDQLPTAEQVIDFVGKTGVNLLAPAVGNIHGMLKNSPNPHLFIKKIKELRKAAKVPLVLHGGSGIPDEDFTKAIDAGIRIIHISTELRRAWRAGIEKSLAAYPNEVAPYKLLDDAHKAVKEVALARLKLFNKIA
jgi:fructose-bisphosphate aldolase class II